MSELREVLRKDVVTGAISLLGCELIVGDKRAIIVETEAYSHDDPACHAFKKTKMKNMAMFGEPGHAYVYFTYGNHWMLCVTAHEPGDAAAVLIRAVMPSSGIPPEKEMCLNGPGKLTKSLGLSGNENGKDILSSLSELRIDKAIHVDLIGITPRIGITKGKGDETLWRFISVHHEGWCTRHKFDREKVIKRLIN